VEPADVRVPDPFRDGLQTQRGPNDIP
jgi:hypothetical protein